jgi:hypothetical protein
MQRYLLSEELWVGIQGMGVTLVPDLLQPLEQGQEVPLWTIICGRWSGEDITKSHVRHFQVPQRQGDDEGHGH